MRKVEHIEQQIRELSSGEFSELRDWVLDQDWSAWDKRVANDAAAGKLDKLLSEAREEFASGRSRPL